LSAVQFVEPASAQDPAPLQKSCGYQMLLAHRFELPFAHGVLEDRFEMRQLPPEQ
jgi:hypothetical protein